MDDEINFRIRRIYEAIEATEDADVYELPAVVALEGDTLTVTVDFGGGLAEEQLSNLAHSVIHNIANFKGHLERRVDGRKVQKAFEESFALKVLTDLSNNDKHGEITREGEFGHSGKRPKLVDVNRVLNMKPGTSMTFAIDGSAKVYGEGSAKAVITGDIVDKEGNIIGDLHGLAGQAVEAWETLLTDLGIQFLTLRRTRFY